MKSFLFAEAVKSVLVNMTIDCELPSDMTELDIHSVFEKAQENLKDNDEYKRCCAIEKLGDYVSDDAIEAYENLLKQAEIDDQVLADDVVSMWEPLEFRYTVAQLLDEIS